MSSISSGEVKVEVNGSQTFYVEVLETRGPNGAFLISFSVAGTITLTSGALPTITGTVNVQGNTAPGFAGQPLVAINCNGFAGLQFGPGSTGSALRSLAIDNAAGDPFRGTVLWPVQSRKSGTAAIQKGKSLTHIGAPPPRPFMADFPFIPTFSGFVDAAEASSAIPKPRRVPAFLGEALGALSKSSTSNWTHPHVPLCHTPWRS